MRKEIVNFILLVLLLSGSIISWVMISQYQTEITRLNETISVVTQRYQDAQEALINYSDQTDELTTLPFQDVQIPITGNPTFTSLEAQLEESDQQIKALELLVGQRKMCEISINDIDMSQLDNVNSKIEDYINENDKPVTGDNYWVTIWDYDYDITEHGFYGDDGLFWYFLAYRDSFEPGIYSVEEGCWVYSE